MAKKSTGSLIKLFKLNNIPKFSNNIENFINSRDYYLQELDQPKYSWIALSFYVFACFSDFLDGYIARKFDIRIKFWKISRPNS